MFVASDDDDMPYDLLYTIEEEPEKEEEAAALNSTFVVDAAATIPTAKNDRDEDGMFKGLNMCL